MSPAAVYSIRREENLSQTSGAASSRTDRYSLAASGSGQSHTPAGNTLDMEALYPFAESGDGLVLAGRLLATCVDHLELVQTIDAAKDFISYDEQMMRVRVGLRELFALREIGDGFGSIVNAVLWSVSIQEEPLTRRQLQVVILALQELSRRPLMHFDSAMAVIDELEDAGLATECDFIDSLLDVEEANISMDAAEG